MQEAVGGYGNVTVGAGSCLTSVLSLCPRDIPPLSPLELSTPKERKKQERG